MDCQRYNIDESYIERRNFNKILLISVRLYLKGAKCPLEIIRAE